MTTMVDEKRGLGIFGMAQACHEVNKAYCESIGDFSQPHWHEAPEWQRKSAVEGVLATLANPDQTPRMSHEAWLKSKRADGWGWGTVKNVEKKTHPCVVEYDELPDQQKTKDRLFVALVNALTDVAQVNG